jgi:hypothetical protein
MLPRLRMQSAVQDLVEARRGDTPSGPPQALPSPPVPATPIEQTEGGPTNQTAAPQTAARRAAHLEFAIFASLLAGAAGIVRATQMDRPVDIIVCLVGSVTGCSLLSYLYFRRD